MKKLNRNSLALFSGSLIFIPLTFAQSPSGEQKIEEITIVGSHIQGVAMDGVLPVTVLTKEDIFASGASTGDELLRSIPQMGEIEFNNEREVGGINDARGDVASINLRGIGTGNTLTLLNGRRLVLHPGTQAENLVPVMSANANTLPVKGLDRLEVLRDGAAAIYGTDAVAGVINYVINSGYEGTEISGRYSDSASTNLDETTLSALHGFYFNDGSSHLTLSGNYYQRDPMYASDRPYAASNDRRFYPGLPEDFVGDTQLRNTVSSNAWGVFDAGGRFRIQPDTLSGCDVALGGGICRNNYGGTSTALPDNIKFDSSPYRTMTNEVERFNFSAMLNVAINDSMEAYGEFLYYKAESDISREPDSVLSTQRFTIADNAALNPFGEEITLIQYRPLDAPPQETTVNDSSYRVLGGFRGAFTDGWDWDSAVVYSKATSKDKTDNRIRMDAFQAAVNSTDPNTAYDIFNGGSLSSPMTVDGTPNSQAVINQFLTSVSRESTTELSMVDFKVLNGELFEIAGGSAGFAAGIEFRRETLSDDRDPLLEGSNPFIDSVTSTLVNESNVLGTSYTPDTKADRHVLSVFGELVIPIFDVVEIQLAARYEDYSDVGNVLKPKIAVAVTSFDFLKFRGSYSEAFRAPNLAQASDSELARSNGGRIDPVQGTTGETVESRRSGGDYLKPEDDEILSFGIVVEPLDQLVVTADWWQLKQEKVIGILGDRNHIFYDALLRADFGSTNPAVVRAPDLSLLYVEDSYLNLQPRTIEGADLSVQYDLDVGDIGYFRFRFNGAYLITFDQDPDAITQQLIDANAAGNPAVPSEITNAGSLIKLDGHPRWRHNASLSWNKANFTLGLSGNYISDFVDTGVNYTDADGKDVYLPIDSYQQLNIFARYEFEELGVLSGLILGAGVNNVTDNDPPLADAGFGYFGSVHSNRGQQYYLDVTARF
ncbi:TonB-dependent receptor domain-containing protein [Aurantivibrio infirmus]